MLRNDGQGNAGSSLANLGLYRDGVLVSMAAEVNGRDVTFLLNDTIDNGQLETYEVRADIVGAERSNDDYNFTIRNNTDVTVLEKDSGFSAPINLSGFDLGTVSIDGGDLLLSRDTAFQLNQTASASTNDVVLWASNLNVGQSATFEDVYVDFANDGNGLENISSVRLVVGNQTLATYSPVLGDTDFTFETTFTVSANTKVKILANFRNTASGLFTIGTVDLGSYDLRYVSNDEVATVDGSVSGIATNIASATLTAIRNDGIDNNTLVPGANNVLVLGFDLRANDVSDVRVTSIQPSMAGTVNISNVTNVRLYQGETLLSTKNDFNFGTINVTIPKNGSKRFTVVADFNTAVTPAQTIQLTVASANVSARNVASNSVVPLAAPITSENFLFAPGGTVEVDTNSSQANRSIITPSMTAGSVYKFDIEAKDDVLRLTDLYIEELQGLDIASALRTATLTIGSTTVTGVILASDMLHFPFGSNGLTLAKDDVVTADLKVAFFDSNVRTNLDFQFGLPTAPVAGEVNGTLNGMRLVSDSTGLSVDRGATSVDSRLHLLARSAPTVAKLADANSSIAYKFTVTAGANRKISLTDLSFDVKGIAQVGATLTLRKDGSNVAMDTNTETLIVGGTVVVFNALAQDDEVAAGTTTTYVVEISGVDTAANLDRTREVRFVDATYEDDVTTPSPIAVSPYNVLPTTASSYKY